MEGLVFYMIVPEGTKDNCSSQKSYQKPWGQCNPEKGKLLLNETKDKIT